MTESPDRASRPDPIEVARSAADGTRRSGHRTRIRAAGGLLASLVLATALAVLTDGPWPAVVVIAGILWMYVVRTRSPIRVRARWSLADTLLVAGLMSVFVMATVFRWSWLPWAALAVLVVYLGSGVVVSAFRLRR